MKLRTRSCRTCVGPLHQVLILDYSNYNIHTSNKLEFIKNDKVTTLYLRGIVYLGGFHFTSRIIREDGQVWYHDGRETGKTCINEGYLSDMTYDQLRKCKGRTLTLAVYTQHI